MFEGITDAIRSWILQIHFNQRQGTHQLWQRHGERMRSIWSEPRSNLATLAC